MAASAPRSTDTHEAPVGERGQAGRGEGGWPQTCQNRADQPPRAMQRLNKTEAGRQASKGRGHRPPVQKGRKAGCQRAERAANRPEVRASNERRSKGMRRTSRGWATHQVHEGDGAGLSAGTRNATHTRKNTRAANWGGDHRGTAGSPAQARWGC